MRLFARSPETTEIKMNLSPLENRKKKRNSNSSPKPSVKKSTLNDYIATNALQSVSNASFSRTDIASDYSPKELKLKAHIYENEENIIQNPIFKSM